MSKAPPPKNYFDNPIELVERLVGEVEFGIQFAVAREMAEEYVGESHSMAELIHKLKRAQESQTDRNTKEVMMHLILQAEELARSDR